MDLKKRIGLSIIAVVFKPVAIGIREIPENEGGGNMDVYVGIRFVIWMPSFIHLLVDQIKELKNKNIE